MDRPLNPESQEGLSGLVLLWDDPVFATERPLRIFSQRAYAPLSSSLAWVDLWYSGLVTRTIGPFWRRENPVIPPSFLFVPGTPPFLQGFVVLPYRLESVEDWAHRLYETISGLSVSPVVLDSESLAGELKPFIQKISKTLLDRKGIRLYVSDPARHPATFGCLAVGA